MRNIEVLKLVLVSMFAMSAVVSATASADTLTGAAYPVTLTGDQDGQTDVITTTAGTVSCKKVSYHGVISGATKEFEASAAYSECTALGFPGTVHMNGCKYKFTMTQPGSSSTTSLVDIVCPVGNEITVTAIAAGTPKCTIHIPPQNGLNHVEWKNVVGGDITGNITVSNITYKHTTGSGLGHCLTGHSATGTWHGRTTVIGEQTGPPFGAIGLLFS